MGRGLLFPLLALLFITATSVVADRKSVNRILYAAIASATLLSFVAIFQSLGGSMSGLLNKLLGTTIPDTLSFSPAGSPLALLTYVIPMFIVTLLLAFTRNEGTEKIAMFLVSAVMLGGIVINSIFVAPGKDNTPVLLSFANSYAIGMETLKQPVKTALLGFGPEGYLNAFTKLRPAQTNTGEAWSIRFTSAGNELFTTVASVGALGLLAYLLILRRLLSQFSDTGSTTELKVIKLGTMVLFLFQLLLPANIVLLTVSYLFLILWAMELKSRSSRAVKDISLGLLEVNTLRPAQETVLEGEKLNQSRIVSLAVTVPLLVGVVAISYFAQRAYGAEMLFRRSLVAASQNDGTNTYELQRQAIAKNPYVGGYHRTYALTNLQLASAIAAKTDLSDQDRNTVAQLIQQSIREGKAAVSLDAQKTTNWETLAQVYRNLINVADGSDQWTIAAYVQAITTDPVNPRLRLELGGIYFQLGQFDQAIRLFQQATELKPDWANAYYNLSAAYKEKGELQNALTSLQTAVSLVPADSADAGKAQTELAELKKQLNVNEEGIGEKKPAAGQLSSPAPLPSPLAKPIDLPQDSGPQTTPAPEPVATPVPTPAQ